MAPAAARTAAVQSPMPGSESATPMARTASGGQGQPGRPQAPSQLSIRKDSPAMRNDGSVPSTPRGGTVPNPAFGATPRPQASRGPSGGTTVQGSGPGSAAGSLRLRTGFGRQRFSNLNDASAAAPVAQEASPVDPTSPSSDHSSDESSSPAQSRVFRRPPRFGRTDRDGTESFLSGMEDDEPQPAFLPYQSNSASENDDGSEGGSGQYTDPSATLRGDLRDVVANAARRLQNVTGGTNFQGKGKGKEKERVLHRSGTSDSSGGSAPKRHPADRRYPSNPLSPRRTAELKGKGVSREGSDGAPSMGSSYSDLDGKVALLCASVACAAVPDLLSCRDPSLGY